MVDRSKMTVAEMLAAARKADSQGDAPAPADEPTADNASADAPSAEEKEPADQKKPAAKTSGGGRPSVAEMLAMARGEKDASKPATSEAKAKPAAKAAAKPAAKTSPKAAPAAKATPADTQSILAAARKSSHPGPMTKAEAAAKGTPVTPAKKAAPKKEVVVPPMPVKPDYAKPATGKKDEKVERRAFLFGLSALAVGFTALGGTLGVWTLGTVRFMFPNILREPPSRFKVGFPDDFPAGQVQTKFKAQFGIWIVNTDYEGELQIFALKSVCTHLGCTPNWLEAEQKFKCPCHGSGFYKDGVNFEGPAPRPLERYSISIANDGQLEVDKSRKYQEEMGQWQDSASFVLS